MNFSPVKFLDDSVFESLLEKQMPEPLTPSPWQLHSGKHFLGELEPITLGTVGVASFDPKLVLSGDSRGLTPVVKQQKKTHPEGYHFLSNYVYSNSHDEQMLAAEVLQERWARTLKLAHNFPKTGEHSQRRERVLDVPGGYERLYKDPRTPASHVHILDMIKAFHRHSEGPLNGNVGAQKKYMIINAVRTTNSGSPGFMTVVNRHWLLLLMEVPGFNGLDEVEHSNGSYDMVIRGLVIKPKHNTTFGELERPKVPKMVETADETPTKAPEAGDVHKDDMPKTVDGAGETPTTTLSNFK
ncbi:uncharacterized protein EV422DRAFT_506359 [Fimicolochytrium jonesii]|uniref:uncharacterized protein n=1 Tax=Fimicolochytrium jonesii TaxID=1396493 RepID=UPI0022FF17A0|nr:uncharacterized protein EV422DRAFT_506359 [Fimicolochytrium jonesii]KAI8821153.1 hypothetical protein EV422DRAFT_506359 [Fimicolochytrium jonesii]